MLCKLTHVTNLSISCTHTCPCTAATAACFQCIKRRTSCPHSLSPSHRAMLGLPRDCISLLLSLLGVAGAPALVLTAPALSVALQDVECVRAAYVAAARAFTIPWQLRALVKAARATPCLPAAYLRLCRAVFAIVRLCFRPVCAPGVSLAYPCFADAAPACLQLSGPRSRRSAFAALFVTLGFPPPPPEDSHNLHCDLLLAGLPANPHVAWLRLNRGSWWFPSASHSPAPASGHPHPTLLPPCPGGGSATGICHHLQCPRCLRLLCGPGARHCRGRLLAALIRMAMGFSFLKGLSAPLQARACCSIENCCIIRCSTVLLLCCEGHDNFTVAPYSICRVPVLFRTHAALRISPVVRHNVGPHVCGHLSASKCACIVLAQSWSNQSQGRSDEDCCAAVTSSCAKKVDLGCVHSMLQWPFRLLFLPWSDTMSTAPSVLMILDIALREPAGPLTKRCV